MWKLDRFDRWVKELLTIADDLYVRWIGLRVLTDRLADTYTQAGEGGFSSP